MWWILAVVILVFVSYLKQLSFKMRTIEGKTIQLLETIYIVENTVKLNILTERYKFGVFISNSLAQEVNKRYYLKSVQEGIKRYNTQYYDRPATDDQINMVLNPYLFDTSFFCKNIYRCFVGFYDRTQIEINNLKTEKAKERRMQLIKDTLTDVENLLVLNGDKQYINQIHEMYS